MSENDLSALAGLTSAMTQEKRSEIEKQLPGVMKPRFDAGVAAGIARAAEIAGEMSEEVARALREVAAVAAARAVEQRKLYDEASRLLDTPEARAEMEAEWERIQSGEVKMYSAEEILRERMTSLPPTRRPGNKGKASEELPTTTRGSPWLSRSTLLMSSANESGRCSRSHLPLGKGRPSGPLTQRWCKTSRLIRLSLARSSST